MLTPLTSVDEARRHGPSRRAHSSSSVPGARPTSAFSLPSFWSKVAARRPPICPASGTKNAVWTWDGSTLRIASATFPLDRFTGHLANDRIEADYVWHDLDRDQLNPQTCVFERFTGRGAMRSPFLIEQEVNSREVIE